MAGQDVLADINPVAFGGAMVSNVAFSLRGLLSKRVKAESKSANLTSSNLYSILTLMSFFLFLPFLRPRGHRLLGGSRSEFSAAAMRIVRRGGAAAPPRGATRG